MLAKHHSTPQTTSQLAELVKDALLHDQEIKDAILSDRNAVIKLLQSNLIDEIKQELRLQKLYLKYDYQTEKEQFLATCRSENTRQGYRYALLSLENYCTQREITTPIAITSMQIDEWLLSERAEGKAPATVRRNAGGVSAFFAYLERKSNGELRNPLTGTKKRPKVVSTKKNKFYSMGNIDRKRLISIGQDINTIISAETNAEFKAILAIMAYRGLRCGAFESMTIHAESFRTVSKGEEIRGELPEICLEYIDEAGIKRNSPFNEWSSNRVKQTVKNHVAKLFNAGSIQYRYSAHDFRHFFALTEYYRDHDIYRVSKLLHHSGIAITEAYLKGLNVEL